MHTSLGLILSNTLAQVIGTATALSFTILGARLLSVTDYGELRYVMTLLPLIMAISLPGFDSIILRMTGLGVAVPLVRVLAVRMLAGCIGSIFIVLVLVMYSERISNALFFLLVVTLVALPFFETATGYRNYLLGCGLTSVGNRLLLRARFGALVILLFLIFLIYVTDVNPLWIYPAWIASTVLATFSSSLRVLIRVFPKNIQWRRFDGYLPMRGAASATLAGLVYTFAFSLDKLGIHSALGPEQLALYSLLIMVPQELAKLLDSNITLFYRDLFLARKGFLLSRVVPYAIFTLFVLFVYILSFYFLSAEIFGASYRYPFTLVALSTLLFFGQSLEYFVAHRTLVIGGANAMFGYSLFNLAATVAAVWIGLSTGQLAMLILTLFVKQLTTASIFGFTIRRSTNAL